MSSIQTVLVFWGLLLFSFLSLSFQNATNQQMDANYETEAIVTASSIGQSILESIQVKAFDETTVTSDVQNPSLLSAALGTETGETSETTFDDIDDYDNFQAVIQMARLDSFQVDVDVYYINQANPDQEVYSQTFSKRIDITVNNVYLENPITLNSIISY